MHGTALSSNKALIGAVASGNTRFLEYVDGTIMTDGHFSDVSNTWIGDIIKSSGNSITNCFRIDKDGMINKNIFFISLIHTKSHSSHLF